MKQVNEAGQGSRDGGGGYDVHADQPGRNGITSDSLQRSTELRSTPRLSLWSVGRMDGGARG